MQKKNHRRRTEEVVSRRRRLAYTSILRRRLGFELRYESEAKRQRVEHV